MHILITTLLDCRWRCGRPSTDLRQQTATMRQTSRSTGGLDEEKENKRQEQEAAAQQRDLLVQEREMDKERKAQEKEEK